MRPRQQITGVVLAGGQSRRFGCNKALVRWQGRFLIQHVSDALVSVFSDCLLVTNTPEQYEFLHLAITGDRFENMGPLAGIHAALRHSGTPWIFVVGCDMPAVTPALITFLCSFARDEWQAVIPWPAAGPEPLCGLYHRSALAQIEQQLQNHKRQLQEVLEKLAVRKVQESELLGVVDDLSVFANVNRRQDLDRLPGSGTASPDR